MDDLLEITARNCGN